MLKSPVMIVGDGHEQIISRKLESSSKKTGREDLGGLYKETKFAQRLEKWAEMAMDSKEEYVGVLTREQLRVCLARIPTPPPRLCSRGV